MTNHIHQIRSIAAIEDRETGIQTQILGELPQQAIGHGVKRARPGQASGRQRRATQAFCSYPNDGFHPPCHLFGRTARKCQQQYSLRANARDQQMGNPMCQRHGLAGSSPGDYQ